ncbi:MULTISPECIES: hypothetical protein [Brevibacillus]|uniref:hypothetical protein n=1 Tax=Brevibacillus TaxID=55080 RepID=UPI000D0E7AA5|nr:MULTISPECIES: hypothetical protein [Brevibacillus]PSJ66978.1 hypothetical protein C7J99_23125 [Brevibacillus brevis]RED27743.1 hypothetical protein DES34_10935 [Brevibacillus brevis]TQK42109.1 hypothetical protein FB479_115101 [Brevibacillus sp. AG162]VEF86780.1 Uncharacterised protein [Brevibacillus brevis]GEC88583.1 hypothetical protein BBR01nite_09140 [Brevibacillus brevis]
MADLIGQSQFKDRVRGIVQGDDATPELWNGPYQDLINNDKFLNDTKLDKTEVAANGANKVPRLDAAGKGAFSITGDAASIGGKVPADFVPMTEVAANGANKVPRLDATGKGAFSITGEAASVADGSVSDAKIANRTIDQTIAPTNTGLLSALLGGIANMIKAITGKADWKTAPRTTLEKAAALDQDNTFTGNVIVDASAAVRYLIARMAGGTGDQGGLIVDQGSAYRIRMTAQGTALDNGSNRFDVRFEKAADKTLAGKGKINILGASQMKLGDIDVVSPNYLVRRSGKDANGKFTQVDYLRPDGTLAIRTTLTGAVDANGNYPTMQVVKYELDGVTVISTVNNPVTYDADGDYLNCG